MAPRKKPVLYTFPAPADTDILVGHDDVMRHFIDAWQNRDQYPVHPVWMLAGPRGIGKATMAYKIARMVYGNVGDFFVIDLAHNIDKDGNPKPDMKSISVYTVRNIIDKMQMSSMSGEWRVVLIDSVDELTTNAANAILKLLEEPPAKVLFLVVAHQLANTLPTIRSRARVEKMRPLTIDQMRQLCAHFIPDEQISTETLKLANGSFGKIAALKSTGGDAIYEDLIETLENPQSNSVDFMTIARRLAADTALYGILLDVIAHFGLADMYSDATRTINSIRDVNLEPETALFKIILDIKKCL